MFRALRGRVVVRARACATVAVLITMAAFAGSPGTASAMPGRAAGRVQDPPPAQDPAAREPMPVSEDPPIDTEGVDPVLDTVEVDGTADTRRADDRYDDALKEQAQLVLRWMAAERQRIGLLGRAAEAGVRVSRAEADVGSRRAEEAAARAVLAARKADETKRRAALAVQQDELRRLAAAVLASAPVDRYSFLGNVDDLSAGDRRDAVRERSVAQQSRRVDAKRTPYEAAVRSRRAQERRVAAARRARIKAEAVLARAIAERDNFGRLLAEAAAESGRRLDRVHTAAEHTSDRLLDRRAARLTAPVAGLDMQLAALDAYWRASGTAPCFVPWWVLAGVGRVETRHGHAHGSELRADGSTTVHILGIRLDGSPGTFPIHDTDGGQLDDDPAWDRAVGPMQFIPGTWRRWATDQNADEVADPHNMYDAAGAAAAYLCFGRGDLVDEAAIRRALLAYNRSVPYGTHVLEEGRRYRDALELPDVRGAFPADGDPSSDPGATDPPTQPGD